MLYELSARNKKLWRAIDEVLFYIWDPIGVSYMPEARDEYDTYAQDVFTMLAAKTGSEERIAEYLNTIQTEYMGLDPNPEKCRHVARILCDWKEVLSEKR